MQWGGGDANLPENPVLDGDAVLGEGPALQELVDAVNGQVAREGRGQISGHWHLNGVAGHDLGNNPRLRNRLARERKVTYLLVEDLLGEDGLHPAHGTRSDGDLHAQGCADEVADGGQLLRVEVDGDQEQHFAKGRGDSGLPLEVVLLSNLYANIWSHIAII